MTVSNVFGAINNFIAYSRKISCTKMDALYHFFKRLVFYSYSFASSSERKEFTLFRNLKVLSKKLILSADENASFKQTVTKVNQLFNDEIIRRHSLRLNSHINWVNYKRLNEGSEKTLVRLHEIFEVLTLKWDCGRNFDESVQRDFWYAHQQAIKVENRYMMIRAKEMGISLTLKALEYLRLVDEAMLHNIIFVKREENLKEAVENLTRNHQNIPSFPEMEAFVQFMSQSGIYARMEKKCISDMVWSRYFFTILYQKFNSIDSINYSKTILLLLYFKQENQTFDHIPPKKILDSLEQILSTLTPEDLDNLTRSFLEDMEAINRQEHLSYHLTNLTNKFKTCIYTETHSKFGFSTAPKPRDSINARAFALSKTKF